MSIFHKNKENADEIDEKILDTFDEDDEEKKEKNSKKDKADRLGTAGGKLSGVVILDDSGDDEIEGAEDEAEEADEKSVKEEDFEEEDFEEEYFEEEDLEEEDFEEEEIEEEDIEEDLEEEEIEEEEDLEDEDFENGKSGKSIGKKLLIAFGSILGILVLIYCGFSVYFYSHFYFFTTINGTNFSGKSVAAVEAYMSKQVDDYVLTIDENTGTQEIIKGADISLQYKKGTELKQAVRKQNPILWVEAFWKKQDLAVNVGVSYDEKTLKSMIDDLKCSDQSTWTASVNAFPEYNGTEFAVTPEVYGSTMNMDTTYKKVEDSISQFRDQINLQEAGCYESPKFTTESPEVQTACDTMNNYLKTSITYDMSPATEVVDKTLISTWLSVNQADMSVVFNQDAVGQYIAGLAEKYDTVGKERTFTTANGGQASVSGGTYGWEIDQGAETAALIASIQAGEVTSRQPAYAQTAATHDAADWGGTYAEINLSSQHMWYVQNGNVIFEADVVTGLPTPEKETPAGAWTCLEKMQNKTLRGEKQSDGSYEYETPVAYWMRITWTGVGFHTATWQPYFGGSRYQTAGSHGCVNMSYSDSETLYGIIQVGDPVIIHY